MLGITSAKVTSQPGLSGWTQVYDFTPSEPELMRTRGRLFAVLAIGRTEVGIDVLASGREITGRLHDEYYGSPEKNTFDAIKNAAQKVTEEFKHKWGNIEISTCVFVNEVIYSAASGGSRIMICRDGALATILESGENIITASGYPKEGDVVLLATRFFFRKFNIETIKTALTSGSVEAAMETFAPTVYGTTDQENLGAIIIKFETKAESFNVPGPTSQVPEGEPVIIPKKNIIDIFNKFIKKLPQKSIYIKSGVGDEVSSQSKKMTFSVGIILLAILFVSIGFGIRQKSINDLKNKYQGMLQIAQNDVDQAISLAGVSPDKSRELFTDSEQKLQEILSLKVSDPKVKALQQKINESRGAILGEYDGTPALFLDLSLLSSGFTGDVVSASGGNVYILDKSGKRIVNVAIDTKKSKVVAGPTVIDNVTDLAAYQDTVYILTSDGIYRVGLGKTKVIDKTWAGDAFISSFAGNMYVLDKTGNEIYRYIGQTDNTFSTQQNWLSASTKPNFSEAVAWGMDGAIYVLYPNAKILKYSLGSPQNFSLSGVTPEIGKIDAIYADPDNQYIYLLDKAGKRVVVIDKKGNYKAQYISDQIAGAKSLVVSEAQKEIILLTGDKLLSIGIKNL